MGRDVINLDNLEGQDRWETCIFNLRHLFENSQLKRPKQLPPPTFGSNLRSLNGLRSRQNIYFATGLQDTGELVEYQIF
jgi:hypothetical protein